MRFAALQLLCLSALFSIAAHAQNYPSGEIFRPLLADPVEPRFFAGFLSANVRGDKITIWSVGVGTNFGLHRWPGEAPGEGWQIGVLGSVFSQFNLDASADDLLNSDFYIGLPLTYRRRAFSARARILHQSSHLGDELILSGLGPQRVDLSVEAADLVLAWERLGWRPYAGVYYLLSGHPDDVARSGVQLGLDYTGRRPLFGARLVGGVDVKAFDETNWKASVSAKVGVEFGRPWPERGGITLLLELYDGLAPFGQFYRDDISYYGASIQLEF